MHESLHVVTVLALERDVIPAIAVAIAMHVADVGSGKTASIQIHSG